MPGDLVSWLGGNLPEWGSDFIALTALVKSMQPGRLERAEDFAKKLETATGFTGEQIGEVLRRAEEVAELVATALDTASRAVDERKRGLLARAAAAGILGDETVKVDQSILFVRTLDLVEVPHMKLLVLIAQEPRLYNSGAVRVTGGWMHQDILTAWPGVADSLDPLVAVLQREGLIQDVSVPGAIGGVTPAWSATRYGERFVDFVATGEPTIRPDVDVD